MIHELQKMNHYDKISETMSGHSAPLARLCILFSPRNTAMRIFKIYFLNRVIIHASQKFLF